ncbi:MAG: HDOD domain-containing protein [Verrucomicrobiota bacterium]|nr:HDOD domain-containing protein [Verrucomicrobiota bacterium]
MGKSIEELIGGIPSLGSYAGVLQEIEAILDDPQSTLDQVGEIIEKDPDLTARLLKLGNSSFFGFPQRIETVADTISLIGIQQVQDLISVSMVIELFEGVSADLVDMESFWKHSLGCGLIARQLATARRLAKPERYFVAGLLHDVGRMVLYTRSPEDARRVFGLYQTKVMLLRTAEQEVLGFNHCEIAEGLLMKWDYPAQLVAAVRHHHTPMSAGAYQMEASLVHIADYLVNGMQLGSSGERYVPPAQRQAWERIGLETDCLDALVESVDAQIIEVEQAFLARECTTAQG